jgi:hypothetical protein
VSITIQLGSGSDEAGASASSTISRIPIGDNGNRPSATAFFNQPAPAGSSPVLPAGQSYRAPTAPPVPSLPPPGQVLPGLPSGPAGGTAAPMNPLSPPGGPPSFSPGARPRIGSLLPGGLGVPGGMLPSGSNP